MDLNFTQQPEGWVAEFELTADANLHIERDERGYMEVLQRSPEGGQYARVEGLDAYAFDLVNDLDLTAIIYPKYIKVVSAVLPTYAVVTSAGEVTEIKSQTKEIEVTANGTTEVTPDAGFSYLNSVKVKTNVAGSGGGGGSASSVEYLDLTGLATLQLSYYATSSQELHLKMTMQGQETAAVGPAAQLVSQCPSASSIYAKIDFDAPIIMVQGTMRQDIKVRDYILSKVSESELASLPRLTESEFYTL